MILSANGSGENQEGLSSVLLPGMAPRNSHGTGHWLKTEPRKQHLELLGVVLPLHSQP